MAEVKLPEKFGNSSLLKDKSDSATRKEMKEATKREKIANGHMAEKSKLEKLAGKFFEGTIKDAIDYMINDVAIPQIKKGILSGIEIIFFNNAGRGSSSSSSSNVPYNSYYYVSNGQSKVMNTKQVTAVDSLKRDFNPSKLEFSDRGEAECVLLELKNSLKTYDKVSVGEVFELCGLSTDWTSHNYGWTTARGGLDGTRVRTSTKGWRIDFPDPYPID